MHIKDEICIKDAIARIIQKRTGFFFSNKVEAANTIDKASICLTMLNICG